MKLTLLLLSLLISNSSLNCQKFKTGKFEVQSKYLGTIIIERDAHFQTETIIKTGTVARYSIKWLNDCSFIMFNRKLLKGKDPITDTKFIEEIDKDTILNEIIEINGNEFKARSKFYSFPDWYESTTKKIE